MTNLTPNQQTLKKHVIKTALEAAQKLVYLKYRWADEREYEDFKDYQAKAALIVQEDGFTLVNLNKSFKLELKHDFSEISVNISISSGEIKATEVSLPEYFFNNVKGVAA